MLQPKTLTNFRGKRPFYQQFARIIARFGNLQNKRSEEDLIKSNQFWWRFKQISVEEDLIKRGYYKNAARGSVPRSLLKLSEVKPPNSPPSLPPSRRTSERRWQVPLSPRLSGFPEDAKAFASRMDPTPVLVRFIQESFTTPLLAWTAFAWCYHAGHSHYTRGPTFSPTFDEAPGSYHRAESCPCSVIITDLKKLYWRKITAKSDSTTNGQQAKWA